MRIKKYIYALMALAVMVIGLAACTPKEYELGDCEMTPDDLAEGVAFTVSYDDQNPNIVYLKSKMESRFTSLWETPQGRFQGKDVTLKMPFAGEYEVKFGVETPAGIVYGAPVKVNIKDLCPDFISGDVWRLIAGGINSEKTWIYDDGSYGYKKGELSYGDPSANASMGFGNFEENWDPGKDHCGDAAMWDSYMTFDLKGRAGYKFYDSSTGETQEGVFGLNESSYVLNLTDADLMHPSTWTQRLNNWRQNFQIIELDENHMRVAYTRVPGNWGGEWIEVLNYVSKDFADNYVPEVDMDPKPALTGTWADSISVLNRDGNSYRTIKWVLSETDDAAGYCDLYGHLAGGKQQASDAGSEMSLVLNAYEKTYQMKTADDEVSGTYSIDTKGFLHFSNGLLSLAAGKNGAQMKANADNTLRVLGFTYEGDEITDLWLGYDINDVKGDRYMYQGFHFVPTIVGGVEQESFKAELHYFNTGWTFFDSKTLKVTGDGKYTFRIEGADDSPYGMYLDVKKILAKYPNMDMTISDIRVDGKPVGFDDSLIERGVGDETDASGNGITARRYILNPWNSDNYFMVNGTGVLAFSSSIEVDINVTFDNGTPFIKTENAASKKARWNITRSKRIR